MMIRHAFTAVLFALCLLVRPVSAQEKAGAATYGPVTGFRGDILKDLADVEKKIEDLAGAVPPGLYTWRPMKGVRSISEVYLHMAGSNYLFPSFMEVKMPAGASEDMDKKVTDKGKVVDALKQSFSHIRRVVTETPDSLLEKSTKMFGEETTYRNVLLVATTHLHEHLGQSIAYARMNKIVPPWTAAEEAKAKASEIK